MDDINCNECGQPASKESEPERLQSGPPLAAGTTSPIVSHEENALSQRTYIDIVRDKVVFIIRMKEHRMEA